MAKQVTITCVNDGKKYTFDAGTDLAMVAEKVKPALKYPILGAKVNGELQELNYELYKPKHIQFVDISDAIGLRMYIRSLCFILINSFYKHFPDATLKIQHSISKGLYCEVENLNHELTDDDVNKIKESMHELVEKNLPYVREEMPNAEALQMYNNDKQFDKVKLFTNRKVMYTSVYYLQNTIDYFYGYLVPSTGYINVFDLVKYHEGMLLRVPSASNPTALEPLVKEEKMFEIFKEHKAWAKLLEMENVGCLNEMISNKKISEIIKINEALHEKKIAQIADEIYLKKDKVKIILIAGPSSSGKTSFCKRLSIQLQVLGFKTIMISLDDYFVDRDRTPRDEKGDFDFESIEAIDINLFNEHLVNLMDGKEVELPRFDFTVGRGSPSGTTIQSGENTLFIVEGIHGLNPKLTAKVKNEFKYKVYVSALTSLSIDHHNRIPTTDNRLLRRMVRDFKYRGYSALDTLKRWPSVRRGEEKNIFPFQEEANAIFNSALLYEVAALKGQAMPLLEQVPEEEEIYSETKRLIKFLSFVETLSENYIKEIPPTSILREFLGGSSFKY